MTNRDTPSSGSKHSVLVSMPMMSRYSNVDFDDLPYERLFIELADEVS